jgi:hypothetical protein
VQHGIKTDERLLKNRKLSIEIEPVSTLGLDGTFAEIYLVSLTLEALQYDHDEGAGKRDNLFERLFVGKWYRGFAPSLEDAVDLTKRYVTALESEFEKQL